MTDPPPASVPGGSGLDEAVAGVLFGQSPGGLHVYDTALRLTRVNTAARRIREFPVDRMIGRPLLDVLEAFHAEDPAAVVDAARGVLETGSPVLDLHFRVRNEQDPPQERVASVSVFRLDDHEGTPQGVAATVTDITERVGAQARLELLDRATACVGTTLDVFRTAAELCEVVVPELADSVTVHVLDSVLRGQAPVLGRVTGELPLRRAASRSVDGADPPQAALGAAGRHVCVCAGGKALPSLSPELTTDLHAPPGRNRCPNAARNDVPPPAPGPHRENAPDPAPGPHPGSDRHQTPGPDPAPRPHPGSGRHATPGPDPAPGPHRDGGPGPVPDPAPGSHPSAPDPGSSPAPGPDPAPATAPGPRRDAHGGSGPGPDTAGTADPAAHPDRGPDARPPSAAPASRMTVPMRARGVLLGVACFHRRLRAVPFDRGDLALAEQLAARAALCLDNARLYTRERSVARIVHRNLRHPEFRTHPGVDTAHAYLPAGAGGGWFDVIPLSGSRVALAAGDTTGHLIDATAAMGELRVAATALSELDLPPDEILARLHDLTSRFARAPRGPGPEESAAQTWPATCVYLVYDPVTRGCAMASAGHPPPALILPDGTVEILDVPQGPPLGQGVGEYGVAERTLPEGSVLVLYNPALLTDGTSPAPAHIPPAGLRRAAAARDRLEDACDAVVDALAPERPTEDVIVLLARTRTLPADRTASWTLSSHPRAVAEARRAVAARLTAWGLEGLVDAARLVVSELVTNAVRYGTGSLELRLIREQALTCEVTDESSTAPQLRRALVSDEGGRGLFITAQLTERWGVRPARRGKTVWAELRTPAD
ncbi:SpoIIE family protein phosphatase [Streptomyces anandii]|uniref:SpoIIE family protein phosphatase n=1 Tax=Streptomyces anandii TaxID=285454 RepID=UPI0036FF0BAB